MASYKIVSYADGADARPGVLVGDTVYDAAAELSAKGSKMQANSVKAILAQWGEAQGLLADIADSPQGDRAKALSDTRLYAPIHRPSAIYCAGANYWDHAREMGNLDLKKEDIEPFYFIKSGSCVIGPGDEIRLPQNYSEKYDWEVEIAAYIGTKARNMTLDNALSCIAGYGIMNDVSARDRGSRTDWPFGMDWMRHKSFDTSAPTGPWIVPAADVGDVQNLKMKTTVSGKVRQDSSSAEMIFSVAEQIVALSSQLTLFPGDIIATGTCGGVGAASGEFLSPGDNIVMEVENIGTLENPVVQGD